MSFCNYQCPKCCQHQHQYGYDQNDDYGSEINGTTPFDKEVFESETAIPSVRAQTMKEVRRTSSKGIGVLMPFPTGAPNYRETPIDKHLTGMYHSGRKRKRRTPRSTSVVEKELAPTMNYDHEFDNVGGFDPADIESSITHQDTTIQGKYIIITHIKVYTMILFNVVFIASDGNRLADRASMPNEPAGKSSFGITAPGVENSEGITHSGNPVFY